MPKLWTNLIESNHVVLDISSDLVVPSFLSVVHMYVSTCGIRTKPNDEKHFLQREDRKVWRKEERKRKKFTYLTVETQSGEGWAREKQQEQQQEHLAVSSCVWIFSWKREGGKRRRRKEKKFERHFSLFFFFLSFLHFSPKVVSLSLLLFLLCFLLSP